MKKSLIPVFLDMESRVVCKLNHIFEIHFQGILNIFAKFLNVFSLSKNFG